MQNCKQSQSSGQKNKKGSELIVNMFVQTVYCTEQKCFQLTVEVNIMQMVQFGGRGKTAWHGIHQESNVLASGVFGES